MAAGASAAATRRVSVAYALAPSSSREDADGRHLLGVNALCVDAERSLLYSAGRDGAVRAHQLHAPVAQVTAQVSAPSSLSRWLATAAKQKPAAPGPLHVATYRGHAGWVNDVSRRGGAHSVAMI